MSKKKKYITLTILIAFSVYCSVTIGRGLDEGPHLKQGKITLDYLLSFGSIDKKIDYREYYSPIYWSLLYFVTEIFPSKYLWQVGHLFNSIFSIGVIFGIGKVCRELFNKKVSEIIFIILFLYPVFFGHMSINNKDTILALSHVWIIYLMLRYLKKQSIAEKANKYITSIGVLTAVATGMQLVFLGTQIPIFLFVLVEVFLLKRIIDIHFSIKKALYDLGKCFIIFYSLLILFWIDAHQNILTYPLHIFQNYFSADLATGWRHNLVNGTYYLSSEVPKSYFLINFIYKSPEYILLSYLFFLVIIFKSKNFYNTKLRFFYYNLSFIILILIFPNLIMFLVPYPIYDGMRLFLWVLPYYCIIPGLTIYYLIENFKYITTKIAALILSLFFVLHLFNFISITPYQYTYLNLLNGKNEDRYNKFENDYWGTSIHELMKKVNFKTDNIIKIATCGLTAPVIEEDFKEKRPDLNLKFVLSEEADYIIMTNRVAFTFDDTKIGCFNKFEGVDIAVVKRNGLILSTIREIKR